jgi:hypothetical protein
MNLRNIPIKSISLHHACLWAKISNIQYVRRRFVVIPTESEQRIVIKFLANDGLGADEIKAKLRAQFTEDANSLHTMQFWIVEVKRGGEDLHDELHQK